MINTADIFASAGEVVRAFMPIMALVAGLAVGFSVFGKVRDFVREIDQPPVDPVVRQLELVYEQLDRHERLIGVLYERRPDRVDVWVIRAWFAACVLGLAALWVRRRR